MSRPSGTGAGPSVPESPRGFDVDAAEELELELALAVSLEEASLAPASPPAVGGSGTVLSILSTLSAISPGTFST